MEVIVNVIYILCALYIAREAFNKYLKAEFNHEYMYYWSLAFFCMAFEFMIYQIDSFYHLNGMSISLHMLETFMFMFMLYSFLYTKISCEREHCNGICKRKILRISFWLILFAILIPTPILFLSGNINITNATGLYGLQLVGSKVLDVYFESIHSLIAMCIIFLIPKQAPILKIAIFLTAISEVTQIINILLYDYLNDMLFQFEWGVGIASITLAFYGINLLIRKSE